MHSNSLNQTRRHTHASRSQVLTVNVSVIPTSLTMCSELCVYTGSCVSHALSSSTTCEAVARRCEMHSQRKSKEENCVSHHKRSLALRTDTRFRMRSSLNSIESNCDGHGMRVCAMCVMVVKFNWIKTIDKLD